MKVNELKKELKGLSTAELVEKENELKLRIKKKKAMAL